MKELLEGKFVYEQPKLLFSQEKISVTLPAGQTLQSEIYLGAADEQPVRGYISSTSRRLVPGLTRFSGQTVCLPYGVDAVGLSPGEKVEGWLLFTTNIGEARLAFEICTEQKQLKSVLGAVHSHEEIAQIARGDFREACRIFISSEYSQLLHDATHKEKARYKCFSQQTVTFQNLEEYLIASRLKDQVLISLPEKQSEYYSLDQTRRESFTVVRSTWGHLRLEIETKGKFLKPVRKVITNDDFIGSRYEVEYVIDASKVGSGRQYGELILKTPYQKERFLVMVSSSRRRDLQSVSQEKSYRLSLMKDYLDYQCQRTSFNEWVVSTHYCLHQLREMDEENLFYLLYEAWVFHQEKKDDQARALLEPLIGRSFSSDEAVIEGGYLYLSLMTGMSTDYDHVAARIRNLYMLKGDSFILLWFLLQLDHELTNPIRALYRMEELYNRGCNSPFLYEEAWQCILEEPGSIHTLSTFNVQAFLFAAKNSLMTQELSMRFAYLSGYDKDYSPLVEKVLMLCYEVYPLDETLEALCKYIIRGNPRKKEYFRWFSLAVNKGLRITRLYEYFIETLDMASYVDLPRPLLLYFKYNTDSLGDAKKAYLYSGVIRRRATDPSTYGLYKVHMKEFAAKQLQQGKISPDHAVIYREFFPQPENVAEAVAVSRLMFTHQLICKNSSMRQVIVRHDQLVREEIYPLNKGVAYPRLFTKDAVILFQDDKQRRYEATVEYELTRLLDDEALAQQVLAMGVEDAGLLLHYAQGQDVSRGSVSFFQRLAHSDAFTEEYKAQIRRRILNWFDESAKEQGLEAELMRMDLAEYAGVDKAKLLSVLIRRGLYDRAMELVESFGTEGTANDLLLTLCSNRVEAVAGEEDQELFVLAAQLYRDHYFDAGTLRYLSAHCFGTISFLYDLRKSMVSHGMDVGGLEEKILSLLMFVCDYRKDSEEILEAYLSHDGKNEVIGAYLSHLAYGSVVKEYAVSPGVLSLFYQAYEGKWETNWICRLALFKEVSRGKTRDLPVAKIEETMLRECQEKEMTFSFFRRLPPKLLAPYQLEDKVYVELHEDPNAKITLHYRLDTGLGSKTQYRSEVMPEMYQGIFNRPFALFYGESIHYYFQVECRDRTFRTSERVLTLSKIENSSLSRYQRINQMLSARRALKTEEVFAGMEDYLRQEAYADEMFVLQ